MTCVSKEYEIKVKMEQEQCYRFYWTGTWESLFSGGKFDFFKRGEGGGIKIWCGRGNFSRWGGMSKFQADGQDSHHDPP